MWRGCWPAVVMSPPMGMELRPRVTDSSMEERG